MSSRYAGARSAWKGKARPTRYTRFTKWVPGKGPVNTFPSFVARRGMGGGGGSKGELKVVDLANATYACDTTGSVTLLSGVATGTDLTDRIGRKIMLKSVQVRGTIMNTDSNTSDQMARVMVVYDKQPTGTAPAITAILTAARAEAFNNLDNRDRFSVIFDTKVAVAGISDTATQSFAGSPTVHAIDEYRRLKHEVIFSGTGATAASISSGALWLVTVGTRAAASGSIFIANCRVRFTDQ